MHLQPVGGQQQLHGNMQLDALYFEILPIILISDFIYFFMYSSHNVHNINACGADNVCLSLHKLQLKLH
jgi:hypothetical protein